MAYPAATALRDASSVEALTTLSDNAAARLRGVAIRAVEGYCHQSFANDPAVTRKVRAHGGDRLVLPKRLNTLTTLVGSGSSLDAGDVFISDDKTEVVVDREAALGSWYTTALRDTPPGFSYGYVDLTGDWGWSDAELPAADLDTFVAIALRLDMEAQALSASSTILSTVIANQRIGVTDISEGPLRAFSDSSAYPMTLEVQEILKPYIWQPQGYAI